ncbi:MAG: response regulator, partial [Candidatus Limnocylindrales bacterium]
MSADRILVVDDHAGFRATARRLLERDGWSVVEADDGAAALLAVAALDPDVVLLDIGLPDASG